MQFEDSETQRVLRRSARRHLRERYPWERLRALEGEEERLTPADIQELSALGWFGLLAPAALGGAGGSLMDAGVLVEELGYAGAPIPVRQHSIAAWVISRADREEPARDHLSQMAQAARIYTIVDTLRAAGTGVGTGLLLKGKSFAGVLPQVAFADLADFVLAPLAMDGERSLAVAPLSRGRLEEVKLLHRAGHFQVHFEGVSWGDLFVLSAGREAARLDDQYEALITALSTLEMAGMMRRILEITTSYISQRIVFGRPIAGFQAARHHAAEMLMEVETTRWTAYDALWRFQEDGDSSAIWLAKHWASRTAERVCHIAHLLHGGTGVDMSYPLHLYTQGLMALSVQGGTMDEMVTRGWKTIGLRGRD